MKNFFSDDELGDIFAELNAEIEKHKDDMVEEDGEITASRRRYEEIIKKRKQ